MSRKIKIDKTMPKPRNPMAAIVTMQFKAVVFDHKGEERGGAKNEMADYLDEYLDERDEDDCD